MNDSNRARADTWPTQQLGPYNPGRPGRGPRRPSRASAWGIGIAVAAILIGGGAAALVASGYAGAPSRTNSAAVTSRAALTSKAALGAVLSAANSPTTPDQAGRRRPAFRRHQLARLRLLLGGIHGQFTFETRNGPKTLAFERGTIRAVTGTSVTVTAADGAKWTWHLTGRTVIRQDHRRGTAASMASGQHVFVGGPVVSGADEARLIVIGAAPSASSPTP